MEQPVTRKKSNLSPIWILPIVALCIGGWLIYAGYRDAGIEISVHFADARGITPGKTKVIARGIPVGTVTDVLIDEDLGGVELIIEIESRAKDGLVEDTKFWIVKPEISAGRISGLDTLLSGSYIGVKKGKSKTPKTHFEGLVTPPLIDSESPGLKIILETDTLYSLQRGSHIYAKNLQIGHLENYSLQDNGTIALNVFIKPEFTHLIKSGTRFWNASGLSLTGDLTSGLTVNVESLASLVYGGITCATPEPLSQTEQAKRGDVFKLYKDFEDAQFGIEMTLQLASGSGIIPGKTKVMYRGLKAGVVKTIDVNDDQFHSVTATILLDPRAKIILKEKTRFWVIRPQVSITGIHNLETIVSGPYITFKVGEGKYCEDFVVETAPKTKIGGRPGTSFTLVSESNYSLNIGSPVMHKQIKVGEVTDISFGPEEKSIHTRVMIYEPYKHLIHANTVFWSISGVKVDGNLSKFEVTLSSLQTIIAGGIAFVTPEGEGKSKPAQDPAIPAHFSLYESYGDAVHKVPSLQNKGLYLQLTAPKTPPLSAGAPVLYNNIKVGEILNFGLGKNRKDVAIQLLIYQQYQDLVTTKSRFYTFSGINLSASLQGIKLETLSLESLLTGGIAFFTEGKGNRVKNKHNFHLYRGYEHATNADAAPLTLHFSDGAGVGENTPIKYKGINIGLIKSIGLNLQTGGVTAQAFITRDSDSLFRETSLVSIVKPQINFGGIRNLGTMLTGPYITVEAGEGKQKSEFHVLDQSIKSDAPYAGLNIILEAPRLGSLKKGSPVYYRQIQVGQVTGYTLSPSHHQVWISVNIEPKYALLIYSGSKFWNSSGVRVSGGVLSGLSISTESVEALIKGGISLATPEQEIGIPAKNGDHFQLAAVAEPSWMQWQPQLPPPPEALRNKGQRKKDSPYTKISD